MKKMWFMILVCIIVAAPLVSGASQDVNVMEKGTTGSDVYALQRRLQELGYLNYRPTGKFSDMTSQAVQKFQTLNDIPADGQVGSSTRQALFSREAVRNESNPSFVRVIGPANTGNTAPKGKLSSWTSIEKLFKVDDEVLVTDYYTQIVIKMKRVGGSNCAQVVTVTDVDFDNYTEIFGGGESWEHRPVLVEIGNTQYAASIFGTPTHSEPLNTSGMIGYTILYFNNSKTDIHGLSDEEHKIAITYVS